MPPPSSDRRNATWHEFAFFSPRANGVLPIAHRGGAGEQAGNSLEAFRSAVDVGFRYIEVDLRATASRELVVWHGKRMERVRPDKPLDLDRLKEQLPTTGQSEIVFFGDVLSQLPEDVRFFVDLKNKQAGEALAELLARTGQVDRICVGSFSHRRTADAALAVERATGVYPCTSLTPNGAIELLYQSSSAKRQAESWRAPAPSAQIPLRIATERVIQKAQAGGALALVWTVNDSVNMHRALDLGVDGVMTDYPSLLKRVLNERGQWVEPAIRAPEHGAVDRRKRLLRFTHSSND